MKSLVNEGLERRCKWANERSVASANQRWDTDIRIRQLKQPVAPAVTDGHGCRLRPTDSLWGHWVRDRHALWGIGSEALVWIWNPGTHLLPNLPWLCAFKLSLGPRIPLIICLGPSGLCLLHMQHDSGQGIGFGGWESWVQIPIWQGHLLACVTEQVS